MKMSAKATLSPHKHDLLECSLEAFINDFPEEAWQFGAPEQILLEWFSNRIERVVKSPIDENVEIFYTYDSLSNMGICATCGIPTYFTDSPTALAYPTVHYNNALNHQVKHAPSKTASAKIVKENFICNLGSKRKAPLFPRTNRRT